MDYVFAALVWRRLSAVDKHVEGEVLGSGGYPQAGRSRLRIAWRALLRLRVGQFQRNGWREDGRAAIFVASCSINAPHALSVLVQIHDCTLLADHGHVLSLLAVRDALVDEDSELTAFERTFARVLV